MSRSISFAVLLPLLLLLDTSSLSSAATISPSIPTTPPSSAVQVSPVLLSFSLEGDNWPLWAAHPPHFTSRNEFFFNSLKNLHDRTGSWPDIRVGANSEDRTAFDTSIGIISETFPTPTSSFPYPEARNITVGPSYYSLSKFLPSGTDMTWGLNFGDNNLTLATIELNAILHAFSTSTEQGGVRGSGVDLKFVELGNEPDLYGHNGHRASGYSISDYVTNWTHFIASLLDSTPLGTSSTPKIVALSLGHSDFGGGNFSPQQAIEEGIFSDGNIRQHVGIVSQHHYSGGCCSARIQDLMSKAKIRSNLTAFEDDIAAVKATGIPYIFGETNTYFNHGVPKISNAGGAAVWLADYTLFGATIGISKMFFHEGIGYKYNLIQPVTLTRSVDDATPLSNPAPPHVQASYYGGLVVNEFLGTASDRRVVEIDFSNVGALSGFAIYSNNALQRVVLINHDPFLSSQGGTRPSLSVSLSSLGTKNIALKKLNVPFADVQTGLTWAGQSFDGGVATGNLQVSHQTTNQPIIVPSTGIVLVQF